MSDESEMDLDATFVGSSKRGADESGEPKAKKPNTMLALAETYQARVKATKEKLLIKQGGTAVAALPVNKKLETEMFNEVVEVNQTPVATTSYAEAPLITLRQLMPAGIETENVGENPDSMPLDRTFRSEYIEFVVMIKKLDINKKTDPATIPWDMPEAEFFYTIMNEAFADFIESDITRMDYIKWSSVGTQTGVGVFSAMTSRLEILEIFRQIIRSKIYEGHMAETFPRQTMLNEYGLTLYAHIGTIA